MTPRHSPELTGALDRLGYSSVTDLFLDRQALHFYGAAEALSDARFRFAPVDLERALRAECARRDDFHFFARMALFTALHCPSFNGWGKQHYMLAGLFAGMLGESPDTHRRACWDHLLQLQLPAGWKPDSIFDPALVAALNAGFPAGMAFPAAAKGKPASASKPPLSLRP